MHASVEWEDGNGIAGTALFRYTIATGMLSAVVGAVAAVPTGLAGLGIGAGFSSTVNVACSAARV